MIKRLLTIALSIVLSSAAGISQDKTSYIDGGYGISKSFKARAEYLSSQYGIELTMPRDFSDITKKANNFTFSIQPFTKSCTMYCPALRSDNKDCVVLIEDYTYARKRPAANVPQRYLLEQELRTVIKNKENPEPESDFNKILTSGEGRELEMSDYSCIRERVLNNVRVEMFSACNTERSAALLAKNFLKDNSNDYRHVSCLYVYPDSEICIAIKIFITEDGLQKEEQYVNDILNSISFENYHDSISKMENVDGRYVLMHGNELYKGECQKVHGKSCDELWLEVAKSDIWIR